MTTIAELVKLLLSDGGHSLVLANGDAVTVCDGRGVSDLMRLLHDSPRLLRGALVADKVVGKAAAALMTLGGVAQVYAEVASQPALNLLAANGVTATCGRAVPHITNRAATGLCPLEERCLPCPTPEECLGQITLFMKEMKEKACKNQ